MTFGQERIIRLLRQDEFRLNILRTVAALDLPHCYVVAGFLRNMIWDTLHNITPSTPLNDIDVIYFSHEKQYFDDKKYQLQLQLDMPEIHWQVKNQARMHNYHQHLPYQSLLHAMSFWTEKETAIAARILADGQIECISVFGFDFLFDGCITYNQNSSFSAFQQRLQAKQWIKYWSKLTVRIP